MVWEDVYIFISSGKLFLTEHKHLCNSTILLTDHLGTSPSPPLLFFVFFVLGQLSATKLVKKCPRKREGWEKT